MAGSELLRALPSIAPVSGPAYISPDDVDFGAAGTIASFIDAGLHVTYCLIADGDAGGFDDAVDRTAIPAISQSEQRQPGRGLHIFGTA